MLAKLDLLLSRLDGVVECSNGSYQALCPGHDDTNPSLSITLSEDGKILMHCHAGCETKDILEEIGLSWKDMFADNGKFSENWKGSIYTFQEIKNWYKTEKTHIYLNKSNHPHMLVVKTEEDGKKDFVQYRYIGNDRYQTGVTGLIKILYHLPEVIRAVENGSTVYVAEGEKDVDTLRNIGLCATTNPGGAGNWQEDYNKYLINASVVIFPDNDEAGQKHVKKVVKNLSQVAAELKIVNLPGLPDKGDVTDWLQAGGTKEELLRIVESAPVYVLPEKEETETEEKESSSSGMPGIQLHTDTWNSEQLVARHGENIRYCYVNNGWFIWDGKRWKVDNTGKIQALAKDTVRGFYSMAAKMMDDTARMNLLKHIKSSENLQKRKAMIVLAESENGIPILPEDMDRDKWLFNTENGTLDLRTGQLKPYDKDDLITKLSPVKYLPKAVCPIWKSFLHRIFSENEELIHFIQKATGYSISGSTQEQCIFILYGTGQNGKSTFLTTIKEILADYAQQTPSKTLMAKKNDESVSNDLARLKGVRFVSSIETEEGQRFAEVIVKQLTGDDTVTARFLFREYFDFRPECKIWIASNHKPRIRGTDYAIWRRIRLIPFTVTIPEEEKDPKLLEKLQAEKEGILAWAIEGCRLWQQEGLKPPAAVTTATTVYKEEMDIIGEFLKECCVLAPEFTATALELYGRYSRWCEDVGERAVSQRVFGMKLSERGFEKKRGTAGIFRNKYIYNGMKVLECAPCAPCSPYFHNFRKNNNIYNKLSETNGTSGASGATGMIMDDISQIIQDLK